MPQTACEAEQCARHGESETEPAAKQFVASSCPLRRARKEQKVFARTILLRNQRLRIMRTSIFFPIVMIALSVGTHAVGAVPSAELPPLHERDMQSNPLYVQAGNAHASPDVTISIDYSTLLLKSNVTFGVTHTHYAWQNGNATAIARAKELMKSLNGFQNTHIMGWGPGAIKTDADGVPSNLDSVLTVHVNKVTELGQGMITFCTAPGWMKPGGTGDPNSSQGDWTMEQAPLPQFEDAFATLCAEVAKKYTNVKYFQVWNEFKGMWSASKNAWDYERYTRFYNKIFKKVKAVRPDALIGGFYQVIPGDGSAEVLGSTGNATHLPIDQKTRDGIAYFLKNAEGMDFFCIDKGIVSYHNPNGRTYTNEQIIKLTPMWEYLMSEIVKALGDRKVPIILSEYYGSVDRRPGGLGTGDDSYTVEQYATCQYASVYNHIIRGSAGREIWMLLWMEAGNSFPQNSIFSATTTADGGQPRRTYWLMKAYKDWFNHVELVQTTSSFSEVEIIASTEAAMVINKRNAKVNVNVDGKGITLPAYGVALLDMKK